MTTRIYQNTELKSGSNIQLDTQASHHLARVLRAEVGDAVTLFNGQGGEYAAAIEKIDKKNVSVTLGEHNARDTESPINLWLAQGIARGEKMDFIIQKAVELGVKKIFPLKTERVNVQLKGDREAKRIQHWQSIVVSACEQSGRNSLPEITAPQTYRNFLEDINADHAFVLSPHVEKNTDTIKIKSAESVLLLIGPEGGLSDAEVNAAVQHGYKPLRLGPRVLRTETATIAALAKLQSQFGDL
jgi:16S rRNA (uracil1498-N3)-methyltransferase